MQGRYAFEAILSAAGKRGAVIGTLGYGPMDALTDWLGSVGFVIRAGVAGVVTLVVTGLVLSRSGLPELESVTPVLRRVTGRFRR